MNTTKKQTAYARAGVNIALANQVKLTLPQLLASTRRKGVIGKVGGFGGLFALDTKKYRQPVLVSSVDGVGTKLKLAFTMNRHDTVGQDLVNHCVNDIAVIGAEPLFFLDYMATGKLEPHVFREVIKGFAKACAENHCALIGGETAQMSDFYHSGEYDLSGIIVGVVERSDMLNGKKSVKFGDVIIGIASNGLHTNGYTLARRIFFEQMELNCLSRIALLDGTIGDELMKVHVSYGPLIRKIRKRFNCVGPRPIKAFAHITGGGFVDNIPRVIPEGLCAVIHKSRWPILPIFQAIKEWGTVPEDELYQVFNMGIGMVAIVRQKESPDVLRFIRRHGHKAWVIGEVLYGDKEQKVQLLS